MDSDASLRDRCNAGKLHCSMNESVYIPLQRRGVLTLPADVRKRHGLDEPGAQVEVVERDDGVIELRPHAAVPVDQAWFWTERWQRMEREADEEIARGELESYDTTEEFLGHLDEVAGEKR